MPSVYNKTLVTFLLTQLNLLKCTHTLKKAAQSKLSTMSTKKTVVEHWILKLLVGRCSETTVRRMRKFIDLLAQSHRSREEWLGAIAAIILVKIATGQLTVLQTKEVWGRNGQREDSPRRVEWTKWCRKLIRSSEQQSCGRLHSATETNRSNERQATPKWALPFRLLNLSDRRVQSAHPKRRLGIQRVSKWWQRSIRLLRLLWRKKASLRFDLRLQSKELSLLQLRRNQMMSHRQIPFKTNSSRQLRTTSNTCNNNRLKHKLRKLTQRLSK